mmetsp:Transcript_20664/g.44856  ORF Transcript_20664/g.44856 Transcript_20664/m.44856 type:complete len:371 (-) Transcript_20664:68-1180(-)
MLAIRSIRGGRRWNFAIAIVSFALDGIFVSSSRIRTVLVRRTLTTPPRGLLTLQIDGRCILSSSRICTVISERNLATPRQRSTLLALVQSTTSASNLLLPPLHHALVQLTRIPIQFNLQFVLLPHLLVQSIQIQPHQQIPVKSNLIPPFALDNDGIRLLVIFEGIPRVPRGVEQIAQEIGLAFLSQLVREEDGVEGCEGALGARQVTRGEGGRSSEGRRGGVRARSVAAVGALRFHAVFVTGFEEFRGGDEVHGAVDRVLYWYIQLSGLGGGGGLIVVNVIIVIADGAVCGGASGETAQLEIVRVMPSECAFGRQHRLPPACFLRPPRPRSNRLLYWIGAVLFRPKWKLLAYERRQLVGVCLVCVQEVHF